MNPNIYNVDFDKHVKWETPVPLRGANNLKWLRALVLPIVTLYQSFLRYRKQKLYELYITPQVCYLERLLNDRFDFALRRIRIVDGIDHPPLYIYQEDELKPVYLYRESENNPVYIYTDGETIDIKDDFIILVPASIVFDNNEMLTLVKAFRLISMRPKIQRV